MDKLFNSYTIYARIIPSIISALPIFILWYFLSDSSEIQMLGNYVLSLQFLKSFSMALIFLYFYSHLIRVMSKYFENKYFIKANGFPTVYLMQFEDKNLSMEYKIRYRDLVKRQFNLVLYNETREIEDPINARKILSEASDLVKARFGYEYLVLKHNIWYGFFRNIIGGSVFSLIICLVNILLGIFYFENNLIIGSSLLLLMLYLILFLFKKHILIQNGEAYAKKLFAVFLSQDHDEV